MNQIGDAGGADPVGAGLQQSFLSADLAFVGRFLSLQPPRVSNGSASAVATVALAPDALVRTFEVRIVAGRADWSPAGKVGVVRRSAAGATSAPASVIVDFGVPRTVSGVAALEGASFKILSVTPWLGAAFSSKDVNGAAIATTGFGQALVPFAEVQTQKLQINLTATSATEADLGERLVFQLPDMPADFDLRIDGGPPVWTQRGAVPPAPADGSEGPVAGWFFPDDAFPYTIFDLGPALTALRGDPKGDHTPPASGFQIELTARVPGALSLEVPDGSNGLASEIDHLLRVTTDGFTEGTQALTFAAEGNTMLPLTVPGWATGVVGLRATCVAKLGLDRTLPPVGPDAEMGPDPGAAEPAATLVVDSAHALAFRLRRGSTYPHGGDLPRLQALEVPLAAGGDGAEISVELRAVADDGGPGTPLPGGRSKPVTLNAGAGAGSDAGAWTTFPFAKPAALADGAPPPWAVLLVSRGEVTCALAAPPVTPPAGVEILRGPPAGPWLPLPALHLDLAAGGAASLAGFSPRLRQTGLASSDRPIAPVVLAMRAQASGAPAADTPVSPSPKGARVELDFAAIAPVTDGGGRTVTLEVTSLLAGGLTLADVDLILTTEAT